MNKSSFLIEDHKTYKIKDVLKFLLWLSLLKIDITDNKILVYLNLVVLSDTAEEI